jgi:hypothetical protein
VAVDSIAGVRAPPRGCFFTRGPAHPGFGWPLAPTPCVGIPHRRGAAAPHAGCPPAARQRLPRESAPAAAGHPGPGGVRGDGRGRCPSAVDGRPPRHTPEVGVDDRLLDLGSLSLSLFSTPPSGRRCSTPWPCGCWTGRSGAATSCGMCTGTRGCASSACTCPPTCSTSRADGSLVVWLVFFLSHGGRPGVTGATPTTRSSTLPSLGRIIASRTGAATRPSYRAGWHPSSSSPAGAGCRVHIPSCPPPHRAVIPAAVATDKCADPDDDRASACTGGTVFV